MQHSDPTGAAPAAFVTRGRRPPTTSLAWRRLFEQDTYGDAMAYGRHSGAPHMLTGARELAALAHHFTLRPFPGQEHDIGEQERHSMTAPLKRPGGRSLSISKKYGHWIAEWKVTRG
ncbi:hypothetical protein [Streptomyces sp. NPDC058955]|uniref:hypothetical protein n=1 Tax=unclassified Streptomyces TaxID=2593676 RepID=UPI003667AF02